MLFKNVRFNGLTTIFRISQIEAIALVSVMIAFIGLLVVIACHYNNSLSKRKTYELEKLKKQLKKRERRNKQKIKEVIYFYNQQMVTPRYDAFYDPLLNTPCRSGYRDFTEWFSSASRARQANMLWERLNSTESKAATSKPNSTKSILKDRVRFRERRNSDEFEIVPQCLDFSNTKNDDSVRRRGNLRLMEGIEKSIEKEDNVSI